MTFYEKEILRIKQEYHSNQWQIDTVIGTRNYIDSHYNKNLNLDLLSYLRYTSKYHLLRLYKRYYGQTPRQYLIEKRLEKSKECLQNGMTPTETCYSIGFESPSSFSLLFKKKNGLTPSKFQKKAIFNKRINKLS